MVRRAFYDISAVRHVPTVTDFGALFRIFSEVTKFFGALTSFSYRPHTTDSQMVQPNVSTLLPRIVHLEACLCQFHVDTT